MTDLQATLELLNRNETNFHTTVLYNENNQICGTAVWLNVGHFEFDKYENLKNIVVY